MAQWLALCALLAACGSPKTLRGSGEAPDRSPCPESGMADTFALISAADSWAKIAAARRCSIDDGAYAELFDEAIAHAFSDPNIGLRGLRAAADSDPSFLPFVLRHLAEGAMSAGELEAPARLAQSECPSDSETLCASRSFPPCARMGRRHETGEALDSPVPPGFRVRTSAERFLPARGVVER